MIARSFHSNLTNRLLQCLFLNYVDVDSWEFDERKRDDLRWFQ